MKTSTMSSQIIDEKVTLTMIVCCVLSLMVLAFRYKNAEPEFPVSIVVKEGSFYTGELIKFTAAGKNIAPGTQLYWDFGDQSNLHDAGINAMHYYRIPGRYDISLTINGTRKESKTIYVMPATTPAGPAELVARFEGPDKAFIGQPVIFKNHTPAAVKIEWNFGETDKIDATTAEAKYAFRTSGYKLVKLVVNGNIVGTKSVYVRLKPEDNHADKPAGYKKNHPDLTVTNEPTIGSLTDQTSKTKPKTADSVATPVIIKKAPPINETGIGNMLKDVADGKKDALNFSPYVCDNLLITVYVNGKKGMSLKKFCEEFKKDVEKSDHLKSLMVTFEKDATTNCIKSISVTYKKRTWIGKVLH